MEKKYPIAGDGWKNYIAQFEKLNEFWNNLPEVTALWLAQQIDIFAKVYPAKATPQGIGWVTGEYDRLYDQLKAEPERKIVCWVNYEWRWKNETSDILRDICAIMGKVMGFNARGIGYGGTEIMIGWEDERKYFLEECERLNVQWLDESQPQPGREVDAIAFAEWLNSNYISVENKDGVAVYVEYGPQEYHRKKQYKITELLDVYKKEARP